MTPPGGSPPDPALPPLLRDKLAQGRCRILSAFAAAPDVTFVRGVGNVGDQLIWAGARALLAATSYREISSAEIPRAGGHTALLSGSGGWSEAYHEIFPRLMAMLEERFREVVVLPSSFDPRVPAVRAALSRSRALIFAREEESWRRIRDFCRTELAPDTAFFFDFAPYRTAGRGCLEAFRTDAEAPGDAPPPHGNDDISRRCATLDEWLWTISRHERVRTDRAHVMIAAAMLGKEVEFRASRSGKVPAIAQYMLEELPVRPLPPPGAPAAPPAEAPPLASLRLRLTDRGRRSAPPPGETDAPADARVTLLLLSWNRPEMAVAALESVAAHVRLPYRVLAVDNGSEPEAREFVRARMPPFAQAEFLALEENLGCAGGRLFGLGRVSTEYVLFLDDDAEVFPGTVEHLVAALDRDPEALGVSACIVGEDGQVLCCGCDYRVEEGVLHHVLLSHGLEFDDPAVGEPGPCGWVGGGLSAFRTRVFEEYPLDPKMAGYFEDIEWSLRVNRGRPGRFRRCPQALALHRTHAKTTSPDGQWLRRLPLVDAMARLHAVHGLVVDSLFAVVPDLVLPDGSRDVAAARLLLELLADKGANWTALAQNTGALRPLFGGSHLDRLRVLEAELSMLKSTRWVRAADAYWRLRRALSRRNARTRTRP